MSKNIPPPKRAARAAQIPPAAQRVRPRAAVRVAVPESGPETRDEPSREESPLEAAPNPSDREHTPVTDAETMVPASNSRPPGLREVVAAPEDLLVLETEDSPPSSTPIRDGTRTGSGPRHPPAELRIQTQIRQAMAAGAMESQAHVDAEPSAPETEDYDSDVSVNSCDSTRTVDGRRIVLSEMPRQAGAILQKAKLELESSGNLKREIRENVVSALQLMYEMVLKLSDSRNLHMVESHKLKEGVGRMRERIAQKHSRALESVLCEYKRLESCIEKLSGDTEAFRQILIFDACEPIRELKRSAELSQKESPQMIGELLDKVVDMSAELKPLREAIRELQLPNLRNDEESAPRQGPDMSDLYGELQQIRREMASRSLRGTELLGCEAISADEIGAAVREAVSCALNPSSAIMTDVQQILQTCSVTHEAVAELRDGMLMLRDTLPSGERVDGLGAGMDELRSCVRELNDTTIETAAPIRITVEHIRGLLENGKVAASSDEVPVTRSVRNDPRRPHKSYAEAVNTVHNPSLIIESVDPRHTSEDVIKTIKSKIDVVALGVGVSSIRRLRNQKVAIGCASEQDRLALGRAIRGAAEGFAVTNPPPRKPMIRLIGVVNDLDNASIEKAVLSQNAKLVDGLSAEEVGLKVIRRTKGRSTATTNVVLEVDAGLWNRIKGQRVKLGYQVVLALDQSPVVQCYNCLGFGHMARDCLATARCGYCADEHDTRECPNRSRPPQCINCSKAKRETCSGHAAYSSDCPEWSRWDRISRSSVRYC